MSTRGSSSPANSLQQTEAPGPTPEAHSRPRGPEPRSDPKLFPFQGLANHRSSANLTEGLWLSRAEAPWLASYCRRGMCNTSSNAPCSQPSITP